MGNISEMLSIIPLTVRLVEAPHFQVTNVDVCYGDAYGHKVMLTFGEFVSCRSRGEHVALLKVQLTMEPRFLVVLKDQLTKQIEEYEEISGKKLTYESA